MRHALIGHTGFVGSTLKKQHAFTHCYRSTDIETIHGESFDVVVCAGAPAQKWLANKEPEKDAAAIDGIIEHLKQVKAKRFILISTVDVFKTPIAVTEDTRIETDGLHAYGLNRWRLEQFVEDHFTDAMIVRLPGLVGPGLKKNVIFDFLNQNNITQIDSRGVFNFYPMVNLWADIETATRHNLKLVHLTAKPVSVADIAREGFGFEFSNIVAPTPARYDMQSQHAAFFGGSDAYQYSARETLQAVRHYAQSEPRSLNAA